MFLLDAYKKSLSRHPKRYRLRLFTYDGKSTFILTFHALKVQTGKHTEHLFSAAYRTEKARFSTLITTYFPPCLSAWTCRRGRPQFPPESFACRGMCSGGTGRCICAAHHCQGRSSIRVSTSYFGS